MSIGSVGCVCPPKTVAAPKPAGAPAQAAAPAKPAPIAHAPAHTGAVNKTV